LGVTQNPFETATPPVPAAVKRKVVAMLAVDTHSFFSAPQETALIGKKGAAKSQVLLISDQAVVTFVGVRRDDDKVRGIRMELSDGSFKQAGGYDDGKYTLPNIVSPQAKPS
jgi:hypothetical protein